MSKLDNLIAQYCPQGVELVEMQTLVKFLNGRAYKQSELLDEGRYKVLRVGNFHTNDKWYYSDLELEEDKYCEEGDLLYTWAATLGPQIWHGEKVIFHYHIWKLVFDEDIIDKRYLYHYLNMDVKNISKSLTNSTMPHVSMASMKKRTIAVPPLEVQREIVRVLDSFTLLTAELTAELTARKKQYEFYRNSLLSSKENTVQCRKLDDVCNISAGGDVPKDEKSDVQNDEFPVPIISNGIGENALYGFTKSAKITNPAVTVAARGTIGYAEYRDYPYYPIIRLLSVIPKDESELNTKYLYYCLQGKKYNVPTSGIPQLTVPNLKSEIIPVPELSQQEKIVEILDNFDAICSDLNIGIPAEIEARQKQYEYYRDAILTYAATGEIISRQTDRQTDRQVNSALFSILSIINRTHRLSSYKGEFVRFSMQRIYEK